MRLSVVLLLLSLAGVLGGAALIGLWALGVAIIADSVAVGAYALLRDYGDRSRPSVHEVPTLSQVLERARAS
ncbi:MAG TPA: hypothetical protein VK817_17710 [Trebonia sp.]|jgi:hypothetical protein|nr:hypothetical protein [Trebonia sp.]